MGSATVRLQEDAKSIKEALTAVHSAHKSTQTSKILVDFEVTPPPLTPLARCRPRTLRPACRGRRAVDLYLACSVGLRCCGMLQREGSSMHSQQGMGSWERDSFTECLRWKVGSLAASRRC